MLAKRSFFAMGGAVLILASCGEDKIAGTLQEASLANGAPDEFLVLPQKPLEIPEDLSVLPTPDPTAGSRVEIDPHAGAKRALGGTGGGYKASGADNTVLAAARSRPISPNIRQELRAEDAKKRARPGGFIGFFDLFRVTPREQTIYNDEKLDARDELIKRRAQGVRTPSIDLTLEN